MLTLFIIIVSICAAAFVFLIFFGKPSHEEPSEEIIWEKKFDEHEKKLAE